VFMNWISNDCHTKLAIVGICKNAGKTTVLNSILKQHSYRWGVLSTGRDGETKDVLFKTPKPRVVIPAQSIYCCDTDSLDANGAKVTVLAKSTVQIGGKALWMVRAEQDLVTEITGPAHAEGQLQCAGQMLDLGAQKVIIDGSWDRKSIVLSGGIDSIILAVGASFGTIKDIEQELTRLLKLTEIDVYQPHEDKDQPTSTQTDICVLNKGKWLTTGLHSLFGNETLFCECLDAKPDALYIPGAFSVSALTRLSKHIHGIKLIFRHPECIKLPALELERFLQTNDVQCLIPFCIKSITINSQGVGASAIDADYLKQSLQGTFPKREFIDIMELSNNE